MTPLLPSPHLFLPYRHRPAVQLKTLEEIDDIFKPGNTFLDISGLRGQRCCRGRVIGSTSYSRLLA